jgi:hypothetical protein
MLFRNIIAVCSENSLVIVFGQIIAVYSENHTELLNTLFGKNADFCNVKADCTYSDYIILRGFNQ